MLLKDENGRFEPREDTAVILFNANSSWDNDRKYMRTITPEEFYPSPSLFVYTLPSIVTGEIAIRNKFMGETSMYILEKQNITEMQAIVSEAFQDPVTKRVIWGWVDFKSEEEFYIQLTSS
jgi:3-oxoacyl-[acyl-carrier-protein] synthase-1